MAFIGLLVYFIAMPFVLAFVDHKGVRWLTFLGLVLLPLVPVAVIRGVFYQVVMGGSHTWTEGLALQFVIVFAIFFLGRVIARFFEWRRKARAAARMRRLLAAKVP